MPELTKIPASGLSDSVVEQIESGGGIPKITSIDYPGDDTAANPAGGQTITINGTNFHANSLVYINGNPASVVGFVNANTLTFTAPAASPGILSLYVVNYDGSTAIGVPGLVYSGTPTWTTATGTLGSPYETASFSVQLQATGDANVTFAVSSGNTIPTGLTLAANGLLSGTIPATDPTTTYTFYVDAIDGQNQETSRSFSVTYTKDAVTWSSPADGAAYSWDVGAANSVSLSATSAAGKSITYSVQSGALPANVSISGTNITGTPNTAQANTSAVIRATAADTNRYADRTLYFTVTAITNFIRKITGSVDIAINDIGLDSANNVYATGFGGNGNGLIAKFNSVGVPQFVKRISGATMNFYSIAVKANGQFATAGYVSYGTQYGFVVQWDSDGNKMWENGSTYPYSYNSVAYEYNGAEPNAVYCVGGGQGDTGEDQHLVRFYPNGQYQYTYRSNDARSNGLNDIFLDAQNNYIYLAGYQENNNYGTEWNGYIAKISRSSPDSVLWKKSISRSLGTLTDESVRAITVDGDYMYGIMTGGKVGQGIYEVSIFKLNASGSINGGNPPTSFTWIRKFTDSQSNGGAGGRYARIYVISGYVYAAIFENSRTLVVKYDTSGNLQWQRTFKCSNNNTTNYGGFFVKGDYYYIGLRDTTSGNTSFIAKFNVDGTGANTYGSEITYANGNLTEAERTDYVLLDNGVGYSAGSASVLNTNLATASANNPSSVFTITNVLG